MNNFIVNSIKIYVEALYHVNKELLKLSTTHCFDLSLVSLDFIRLCTELSRFLPFYFDRKEKVYKLASKDGIIPISKHYQFVTIVYQNILKNNYDTINSVIKIRNKAMHSMHSVRCVGGVSSGDYDTTLRYRTDCVIDNSFTYYDRESTLLEEIDIKSLIKLLIDINKIFDDLVKIVMYYGRDCGKENEKFFEKFSKYKFDKFSELFNSQNLEAASLLIKGL